MTGDCLVRTQCIIFLKEKGLREAAASELYGTFLEGKVINILQLETSVADVANNYVDMPNAVQVVIQEMPAFKTPDANAFLALAGELSTILCSCSTITIALTHDSIAHVLLFWLQDGRQSLRSCKPHSGVPTFSCPQAWPTRPPATF